MRVSEISVKRIRVNQGLGVFMIQLLNDKICSYTKKAFWHWQFGKIGVLDNFKELEEDFLKEVISSLKDFNIFSRFLTPPSTMLAFFSYL